MNAQEEVKQAPSSISEFFKYITEQFDQIILEDVGKYYQTVADEVVPILGSVLLVWIIYQSYQCFAGNAEIRKTVWTIAKFVAIVILIGSWGDVYAILAVPAIEGIPELVAAMTGTDGDSLVMAFANQIFEEVSKGLGQLGSASMITSMSMAIPIAMIYSSILFLGVIVIALYFLIFLQCKLIIALMIILTPIFLGFAIFDSTRKFFDNWVSILITQFFTLLILNVVTFFIISVLSKGYKAVYPSEAASLGAATGILFGEFVAAIVFFLVPRIASNLASNGFSINAASIGNFTSAVARLLARK